MVVEMAEQRLAVVLMVKLTEVAAVVVAVPLEDLVEL
jgi:hypothetical protein